MIKKLKINTQQFLNNNIKQNQMTNYNLLTTYQSKQKKVISSGKKKFREFVLNEKLAYTFFVTRHNNGNYYYAKVSFLKMFNFKKFNFLKFIKLQRSNKIKFIAKQNISYWSLYKYLPRSLNIFLFNNQEDFLDQKLLNIQKTNDAGQLILMKKKHPLKSAVILYHKLYKTHSLLYILYKTNLIFFLPKLHSLNNLSQVRFFYFYANVLLFNALK